MGNARYGQSVWRYFLEHIGKTFEAKTKSLSPKFGKGFFVNFKTRLPATPCNRQRQRERAENCRIGCRFGDGVHRNK